MQYVYGPVPSRRLGQSLGVDPIPAKSCNYNCVYCQLGRTKRLILERQDFQPPEAILSEVEQAVSRCTPGEIDYVTIVGQGEPLLYAGLGRLIQGVKRLTDLPVAVITNSSLIWIPWVRDELADADVVMPSLDCADEATFRRINRPSPMLRIGEIISGLAIFRKQFRGKLWVETMLVAGINDDETKLLALRDSLAFIKPDQLHVNIPVRPPAESWVRQPDGDTLIRATTILGEVAAVVSPYDGVFALDNDLPREEAILQILRRHPMDESEMLKALGDCDADSLTEALSVLAEKGLACRVEYRGRSFWRYIPPESASGNRPYIR